MELRLKYKVISGQLSDASVKKKQDGAKTLTLLDVTYVAKCEFLNRSQILWVDCTR